MNEFVRAVAVIGFALSAGVAHAGSMSDSDHSKMMSMDSNKDGKLSKSELQGDKAMSGKFEGMDSNKDGMIDSSEMEMMKKDGGSMGNSSMDGSATGGGTGGGPLGGSSGSGGSKDPGPGGSSSPRTP